MGRTRRISRTRRKPNKDVQTLYNEKKNKNEGIIHQIFYNIGKGELNDIPQFKKCYDNNKQLCKKNKITYKLWTENDVTKLLQDKSVPEKYRKLYAAFDSHPLGQPIQKIDFARYLILWLRGGIYIDLDICIIDNEQKIARLKKLFEKEYFFVRWHTSKLPYNALLGTHKQTDLYKDILDHCYESFYEKVKQPIYKTWKGRFVFQTTGHFMLNRVIKKNKIKSSEFLNIMKIQNPDKRSNKVICKGPPKCANALFEDANVSVWYSGK